MHCSYSGPKDAQSLATHFSITLAHNSSALLLALFSLEVISPLGLTLVELLALPLPDWIGVSVAVTSTGSESVQLLSSEAMAPEDTYGNVESDTANKNCFEK